MQPTDTRPVIISFRLEHLLGWGVTIALCLAPVITWAQLHPLGTIHSATAYLLSIGRITGLVGMVMYALNLVYATRLRFLERFFGGLNRVYIAHHVLGGLALVMLSLHPLFLALSYVKLSFLRAALLLVPNGLTPLGALFNRASPDHGAVLSQWAIFFGIIAFWGMVVLLLITFFVKIPYHIWLFLHKFLGVAFFIAGLHVLFISSDTSVSAPLKYYTLVLAAMGIAAFAYRTLAAKIIVRTYRYSISAVRADGGGVTHLIMTPLSGGLNFKPGQFVFIRILDAGVSGISGEWHPFSISSAPADDKLRLSVKALGDYTSKLGAIKEGMTAEIEGAYGRFSYTNYKNKQQIWIAGGIGITPFISMASSLKPNEGYKIDLYYSVKTESELIDWQALQILQNLHQGEFRIFPYVGDKEQGFLSADYIEQHSDGLEGKDIYICGPPPMMKSMRKQCRNKGIAGANIHSEEFAMT